MVSPSAGTVEGRSFVLPTAISAYRDAVQVSEDILTSALPVDREPLVSISRCGLCGIRVGLRKTAPDLRARHKMR